MMEKLKEKEGLNKNPNENISRIHDDSSDFVLRSDLREPEEGKGHKKRMLNSIGNTNHHHEIEENGNKRYGNSIKKAGLKDDEDWGSFEKQEEEKTPRTVYQQRLMDGGRNGNRMEHVKDTWTGTDSRVGGDNETVRRRIMPKVKNSQKRNRSPQPDDFLTMTVSEREREIKKRREEIAYFVSIDKPDSGRNNEALNLRGLGIRYFRNRTEND